MISLGLTIALALRVGEPTAPPVAPRGSAVDPVGADAEASQPSQPGLPRTEAPSGRVAVAPTERTPLPAAAPEAGITFVVLDHTGTSIVGARVFLSRSQRRGPLPKLGPPTLPDVLYDGLTDARGMARVAVADAPGGANDTAIDAHARVEAANGVSAVGSTTVTLGGPPRTLTYRVEAVYAGAVALSDGAVPIHVAWAIEAQSRPAWRAVKDAQDRLTSTLQLHPAQLHVLVPRDPPTTPRCRVAVCHPRLGWFRATADLVPVDRLVAPTLLEVPETGTQPPVPITVRCVDPRGEEVATDVRVMVGTRAPGSADGGPRFGRLLRSGTPQLLPPDRIDFTLVDHALSALVGTRSLTVDRAQTITFDVPFTPRLVALQLRYEGAPYYGEATAYVHVTAVERGYTARRFEASHDPLTVSLPVELPCELTIRADAGTAKLALAPAASSAPADLVVDLR